MAEWDKRRCVGRGKSHLVTHPCLEMKMKKISVNDIRVITGGLCNCICKGYHVTMGAPIKRAWSVGLVPTKAYCKDVCRLRSDPKNQDIYDCVEV